jgi:hypothetical protein
MFGSKCARLIIAAACLCSAVAVPVLAEDPPAAKEGGDAAKPKLQPVDFRKLKELLPAQLVGLKRTKNDGQKLKLGDVTVSSAEAGYTKPRPEGQSDDNAAEENPPGVDVTILDYANTDAAGSLAAAWANNEIDQESDDGYQKTVKVAGHPGLETYDKQGKSGTLQLYVADRFIVTINTRNLPAEKTMEAAKALQLEKLAAMK